jgi:transposase
MSTLAEQIDHVIGVDPDRDRLTVAVIDVATTGVIAKTVLPADPQGYAQALAFAAVHTSVGHRVWSIEGAGSYGAGLAKVTTAAGERVVGFDRPDGRAAKDGAKSDALDAVRAARELLGRERWAQPRARGAREAIRVLLGCRDSAQTARTAAINELKALVVTCDPELRERLRHLTIHQLAITLEQLAPPADDVELTGTVCAMRSLARRIHALHGEVRQLDRELIALVKTVAPQLLDEPGVGVVIAAQVLVSWSHPGRCRNEAAFARLAGVAPIEATSGQVQTRHRLSRGGDRALNRALHLAVLTRSRQHEPTRAYIARRISEGKTPREARRCLKRYLARHLYRILEHGHGLEDT